jgi:hypothetical protein
MISSQFWYINCFYVPANAAIKIPENRLNPDLKKTSNELYRCFVTIFCFNDLSAGYKLSFSLLYKPSFMQTTTEAQTVDAGMKVFRNPINVNWRSFIVPAVLNQKSRIRLDIPSNRSAINTLAALCAVLPVSSGIPFRTIRKYTTFMPKYSPATSALTRDKAMRRIGIANMKK